MKKVLFAILLGSSLNIFAQDELPKTNIVMVDMVYQSGNFYFSNLKKIASDKNMYENQPRFSLDGSQVFYSCEKKRKKKASTTDIKVYTLSSGKTKGLTSTPDNSEFSPKELPTGGYVSCVRTDNEGGQKIAIYNKEGNLKGYEELGNSIVGYYSWMNLQNIFVFTLPEPFALKLFNTRTQKQVDIVSNIGRFVEFFPRDNCVYYVDKNEDDWKIMKVHVTDIVGKPEVVVECMPEVEDYTLLNDGSLLCCSQGKIYHFAPNKMGVVNGQEQVDWRMIADLGRYHYPTTVSRIAVSPNNNKLALVCQENDYYFDRNKEIK